MRFKVQGSGFRVDPKNQVHAKPLAGCYFRWPAYTKPKKTQTPIPKPETVLHHRRTLCPTSQTSTISDQLAMANLTQSYSCKEGNGRIDCRYHCRALQGIAGGPRSDLWPSVPPSRLSMSKAAKESCAGSPPKPTSHKSS